MLLVLLTNATLLQHSIEVLRLDENHRELLCLGFDFLLKDHLIEELLRCHIQLKQVDHEHNHNFDRLLVELRQIESFLTFLLLQLGARSLVIDR